MSLNKQAPKYKWWLDKKMIGTFLLIIASTLFLFSYMKVPFLTSMHKYTIGMLLGWYHPFVYTYVIYLSLVLIFNDRVDLPKWVKITKISYWFVAISIVFISTQTGYFQSKGTWLEIGAKPWHSIKDWWSAFISSGNAWAPAATNGGVIGAFLYAIFAMMISGIGAFIISIIMLIISVSFLISGTAIGLYKQMIQKEKIDSEIKEISEEKNADIEDIISNTKHVQEKPKPEQEFDESSFPFDDPYK